ncbi:MAG TPA: 3-oxoadipate enol-lactonase [Vicinamibacteria bacterium]
MSAFARVDGLRVHYALGGSDGAPVVVLSHSLGADMSMWDPQLPALEPRFRVLRYDTRGHGRTDVPSGPYSLEELARDALGLLDALGLARVHFCGLSMGGMVGMWLGAHAPARVDRLVLCNTAARIGTAEAWNARIDGVRRLGMRGVAPAVVERWLTPELRARAPETAAAALRLLEAAPADGYVACCEAIRDADLGDALGAIRAPTLVVAGSGDRATPPADGKALAEAIPDARYVELPAAHLSNLEAPERFTAELLGFLLP